MRLAYALMATDMRMRENDVTLGIPKTSYMGPIYHACWYSISLFECFDNHCIQNDWTSTKLG